MKGYCAHSILFVCCFQTLCPLSKSPELQIRSILAILPASQIKNERSILKNRCFGLNHSRIHENESRDMREESDTVFKSDFYDGSLRRRSFLRLSFGLVSMPIVGCHNVEPAHARGLVKFPIKEGKLLNKYHFMRAGESLLEEEGVLSTNPLFL